MKVFIFDFDGTISTKDTTDLILGISNDERIWQIEEEWRKRKITSFQCMKEQTRFLKGIEIKEVQQHLKKLSNIDPYFSKLVYFLKTRDFYTLILSEGYDLSIKFHGVQKHIEDVYSSTLLTKQGKLTGELHVLNDRIWPYNKKCLGCCICKVDFLLKLSKKFKITKSFAVGNGGSDACLFQYVDVSFSLNQRYKATYQVRDLFTVFDILNKIDTS